MTRLAELEQMNKISAWIDAARLRTLPLASACVLMGSALATRKVDLDWKVFSCTLGTALLLQILSNLANDYGDFSKGTDDDGRIGPERALQSGAITTQAMMRAITINAVLALGAGLYTLQLAFGSLSHPCSLTLLGIGILSIAAAIGYTMGKRAYGYKGLGDLAVFLFFGVVGVGGTFLLQIKSLQFEIMLPMIAIGLLSVAVLNLNNLRDIENDALHGKRTIPVKIGLEHGKSYQVGLVILTWMCLTIWWLKTYDSKIEILFFLPAIIFTKHIKSVLGITEPTLFDPELKKVALGTFAISLVSLMLALFGDAFVI
jgi:1,4-dihydroxy-2-naphthoate octaprenyltransferase